LLRFLRSQVGLEDVVRVAVHHPDIAGGKLLDVARALKAAQYGLALMMTFLASSQCLGSRSLTE
jgi:hypothetical protein